FQLGCRTFVPEVLVERCQEKIEVLCGACSPPVPQGEIAFAQALPRVDVCGKVLEAAIDVAAGTGWKTGGILPVERDTCVGIFRTPAGSDGTGTRVEAAAADAAFDKETVVAPRDDVDDAADRIGAEQG